MGKAYERAYVYELRKRFVTIGKLIFESGLTSGSGGQISARILGTDKVMVKPTGFCLGRLKPEDMVIINMQGEKVEGRFEPTSEVPFHLGIYKKRENVNAIVHSHSPIATAFGIAGVELLPLWSEAPALVVSEGVPIAKWAFPGTQELAEEVVKALGDKYAVILEHHGVVAVGESLEAAYQTAKDVEWLAKIQLITMLIGKPKALGKDVIQKYREHAKKYGAGALSMLEVAYPPRRTP